MKAKLFNRFSLNIAELIEHLNGGKKTIAPFCKFTSFKAVAANLCIIWSESNDILTKKWKKIQKVDPIYSFWMQTKNIEVTHALQRYSDVLSLHILLVWADLHISWFSGDYPLCSFSVYSFCCSKSQVLSLLPLAWLSCSLLSNYR